MKPSAYLLAALVLAAPATAFGERPDDVGGTLRIFFVHEAKRALELSDEQALELLPLTEKLEGQRQEAQTRRRELARQLRELGQETNPAEADVGAAIAAINQAEVEARTRERETRDEMLALLDPRQQARFMLFIERFREAVARRLQERRQRDPRAGQRSGQWGR